MNYIFKAEAFKNEKFDIILLAGQSNAEGYGIGPVENEYEEDERIMQLCDSYTVMYRPNSEGVDELDVPAETFYEISLMAEKTDPESGKLGCFATEFVRRYAESELEEGRKILLVRAAVGGTGFMRNQWTPDGVLYKRTIEMTDLALSLNPENRLVVILWHQGGNEAVDGKGKGYDYLYSYYFKCLTRLVSDFREKYGLIPFLAGGHCDDWIPRYAVESPAITDASKAVLKNFEATGFVETAGLGSNDRIKKGKYLDDVHFNRPSLYELGDRYFELYKKIK